MNPNLETPGRAASVEAATPARRLVGVFRLLAGLLVAASVTTQIVDQFANDAFVPDEYFGYFTIQSSLMNVVVLLVGGVVAVRSRLDPELLTRVRMSVLAYAVVTAVVYNLLLRNLPPEGFVGITWPNEVLHVWAPILILLDWVLAPGRPALAWRRIGFAIVYPLAWVVFALVRGTLTGFYTYPFLVPTGPGGSLSVALYVLGIAAFIVAVSAAAIGVSRLGAPFTRRRMPRPPRPDAPRARVPASRETAEM